MRNVLRYLGYILVVLAALGLAAGELVALAIGLDLRITRDQGVRLTVLDVPARESPAPARGMAVVADRRTGRPIGLVRLVFRFDDGWTELGWVNTQGVARCTRRGGLAAGRHWFEVYWPEEQPLLDVRARGTIWVLPERAPVVWVDAAAVLPRAEDAAPPAEALSALNALAKRCSLVYLVLGDADHYARARHRLDAPATADQAAGAPIWVDPQAAPWGLNMLREAWPEVAGALVATPELKASVAAAKIRTLAVPPADGSPGAAEAARPWRAAVAELGTAEPVSDGEK